MEDQAEKLREIMRQKKSTTNGKTGGKAGGKAGEKTGLSARFNTDNGERKTRIITVTSGKGLVKGGELSAGSQISIKTVGSAITGANSQLMVGADPEDINVFRKLEASLAKNLSERTKVRQTISFLLKKSEKGEALSAEHQKMLETLPKVLKGLEREIARVSDTYKSMKDAIDKSEAGSVTITGTIFEGAKIVISNVSYYVHNEMSFCRFKKNGLEIEIGKIR